MNMEDADIRLGRNTTAILSSQLLIKIISFLYMVFLARHLGEKGLGQLTFAAAFAELFNIFSDFGLSTVTVREVSRNRGLSDQFLKNVLSLRLLISMTVFIVIVAAANLSGFQREVLMAIYLYGLAQVIIAFGSTYQSILNAFERMYYGSIISTASTALISITGLILIQFGFGVVWFASLHLVWAIPAGWAYYLCGRREGIVFQVGVDWKIWKYLITSAVPIGFGVAMYVIYNRVDLIMLKYMKNYYDVGIYSVAYRMMGYFHFLIWALMGASAPAFSKHFARDRAALKELGERSARYLIFFGTPVAVGSSLLAESIIRFLYEGRFQEAATVFALLALTTAIVFFGATFGTILLNADLKGSRFYAWTATGGVIFNILLNLFLIPRFSYLGAAAATIATDLITSMIAFIYVVKNICRIAVVKPIVKALISCSIMAIPVLFLREKNIWLPAIILVGMIAYIAVAVILRFFTPEDGKLLRSVFLSAGPSVGKEE
ncbi:MAG: flippase [Acidobacteriota bacterium]